MTKEEAEPYINAFELRERVIAHLAIFYGTRPGEMLALQRRHISNDCRSVRIEQRLYRGDIDTPKTRSSIRIVAIPPQTATQLMEWMELVPDELEAWVVKGGVKIDHWGGGKVDHYPGREGFALLDLRGRLERRPATRLAGRV